MENKYPIKDGWLKAKLTIEPGIKFTQDQVIKIITLKDPSQYEVAEFKHFKTVIRITLRRKKEGNVVFNNVD